MLTKLQLVAILAAGCLSCAAPMSAQPASSVSDSALTCGESLELMKGKLEANYAGFVLEVTGPKLQKYHDTVSVLRKTAAATTGNSCYFVLREFIGWFHDPHLFVYQSPTLDTAETSRRARQAEILTATEQSTRADFTRRAGQLDALEGIWYDGALRVAIVKDTGRTNDKFVAVLLNADTTTWAPGAVRARFTRRKDGTYAAQIAERNHSVRQAEGVIHKRTLLRLSPGIWGKVFPVASADSGFLDATNAHRPTLRAQNGTVIVSIPSHDFQQKRVLDSLVKAHVADLENAERLIVDLRGNEGGASGMSDVLLPYIASENQRPSRLVGRDAMMMSTPDQIRYARRAFGPETSPFVRSLIARMEAHPGKLVTLNDNTVPPAAVFNTPVIFGPKRVGILVDGGTISAAEVLVLRAMQSERVIVFGEPTSGALDYQSTSIVSLSPKEKRWYLGYPTIARSGHLPTDGMRGVGIIPNVRLNLSRLDDPIAEVERLLSKTPY